MASTTRKYYIQHLGADGSVARERIIEATNRATALTHATNTTMAIELMDTETALRLGAKGVKVEIATGEKSSAIKGVDPDQQALPGTSVAPSNEQGVPPLASGEFQT